MAGRTSDDDVIAYTGFHPPSPKTSATAWSPARIDPATITPDDFFTRYIATRTPVILSPFAETLRAKWTKAYLARTAGSLPVIVEQRDAATGGFGSGKTRINTTFAEFLASVDEGGTYMTTQYGSEEDDGVDSLCVSENDGGDDPVDLAAYRPNPLRPLLPDIAKHIGLRPALLGPLVPQTMNLWLGSTRAPTSSGLHHDFQDNLYVLLRGEKTFTVFSPKDADKMYTHGGVRRVGENGYVHYIPGVRDDGANRHAVAAWKVRVARRELAAAEAAGTNVGAARETLAELTDEDEDDDGGDFPGFGALRDDYEDDSDVDADPRTNRKRPVSPSSASGPPSGFKKLKPSTTAPPPSFSRIPVTILHAASPSSTFPLLADATKTTFTLRAGDALYLPTGWFHEVASANAKDAELESAEGAFHMALNYWLAPPTGVTVEEAYEDAYAEDYWQRVEAAVEREMEQA
ncbi:cupin-like domain-containing protein [Geranomyces variabilis]|nr:cupin-like domain-containing protein [Geranomyces variabilis]